MLFVQGSYDTFGTHNEFLAVLTTCPNAHLHVVECDGHSFKIKGKETLSADEVYERVQEATLDWIGELTL